MDKRVPEMRFKGFTDDWEQHSLDDMAESFMYGLNASSIPYDGINKYLRITDIDDKSHKLIIDNLTSPNVKIEDSREYLLKTGDLLFARTGASVGKTYLYNDLDGTIFFAGFLIRMRIRESYNRQFIFQSTLTEKYNSFVKITSQRSGQPGINAKEYSEFHLEIPSKITEQNKIGNLTEKLDALIDLHQERLTLYESVKATLTQKMFPLNYKRIPKIRFVHFSGEWIQQELGKIGDFSKSNIDPRKTPDSTFYEYSMPAYDNGKYPSIVLGKTMQSNRVKISGTVLLINKLNVRQKRIWLVEKASINSVASSEFMPFNSSMIDLSFLNQMMLSNNTTRNLESISSGTSNSQKRITPSDMFKYKIGFPSDKREQAKIGQLLKMVDNIMILERKNVDNLKIIKMYYLKKLFV